METKRPSFITFISYFYFFGVAVLLLSLVSGNIQEIPMGLRFGVPGIPETIVIPLIALFTGLIAYGYYQMTRWGYRMMLLYQLVFGLTSLSLATQSEAQLFVGNAVWAVLIMTYTISQRRLFT